MAIMILLPLFSATIAKLMSTQTGHVIAALFFLKHHLAFTAPLVLVLVLKDHHPILVAVSTVSGQQTQFAEGNAANGTLQLFL